LRCASRARIMIALRNQERSVLIKWHRTRAEYLSIRVAFRMGSSYVEERIWSDCRDGNNSRRTRLINSVVRRNIILPPARPLRPTSSARALVLASIRINLRRSLRALDSRSSISSIVRFDLFNRRNPLHASQDQNLQ